MSSGTRQISAALNLVILRCVAFFDSISRLTAQYRHRLVGFREIVSKRTAQPPHLKSAKLYRFASDGAYLPLIWKKRERLLRLRQHYVRASRGALASKGPFARTANSHPTARPSDMGIDSADSGIAVGNWCPRKDGGPTCMAGPRLLETTILQQQSSWLYRVPAQRRAAAS